MTQKPHILVVDDDERLRSLITQYLSENGFFVTAAKHAGEARQVLARFAVDAMVLDVMMPGETGLEFLGSLDVGQRPPTLMLSARGEPDQRIEGLEMGAQDYLPKPFEPKELVLRLRTILGRMETVSQVRFGEYEFLPGALQLKKNGEAVHLTGGEAQMLKALADQCGSPISREALAQSLALSSTDRSIDVQITRLRKKIETNPGKPVYIQTVRGKGYMLAAVK